MEPKSTIDTWDSNVNWILKFNFPIKIFLQKSIKRKAKDIDIHQRTHIIGKSTLDNWNNIPRRRNKHIDQLNTRPIHVDPQSHIDTWSDNINQRRSSTGVINETPRTIHYDDVKSTIDNWQDKSKSYRRLRPKLLQVNSRFS